jgi:hypothetical protein
MVQVDVSGLEFYPLTAERWTDFEKLFGKRGACGGCWCMWWRLKRSEFERQKGEGNRKAIKRIVDSGSSRDTCLRQQSSGCMVFSSSERSLSNFGTVSNAKAS